MDSLERTASLPENFLSPTVISQQKDVNLKTVLLNTENAELIFDVEQMVQENEYDLDILLHWGAIYCREDGVGSAKWKGANKLGTVLKIERERLKLDD